MKIAVVTICTRNLNYRDYSIDNSREYCQKYGYDFILYEDKIDPNVAIITNKTIAVLQNIDNYDWIFMKDADSLFYNFNYRIENYVDNDYNYIGSWSKMKGVVNLGHLLIKCTPQVCIELEGVLSILRQKILTKGEQPIYNNFWDYGWISPVKKLSKHIFNAHQIGKARWDENLTWRQLEERVNENRNYERFGDIKNDTFIVHYPGTFLKTRDENIEQQVYRSDRDVPMLWNFSESYLLEFISMYNKIKKMSESQPNNKKIVQLKTSCKPRVKKTETKKNVVLKTSCKPRVKKTEMKKNKFKKKK